MTCLGHRAVGALVGAPPSQLTGFCGRPGVRLDCSGHKGPAEALRGHVGMAREHRRTSPGQAFSISVRKCSSAGPASAPEAPGVPSQLLPVPSLWASHANPRETESVSWTGMVVERSTGSLSGHLRNPFFGEGRKGTWSETGRVPNNKTALAHCILLRSLCPLLLAPPSGPLAGASREAELFSTGQLITSPCPLCPEAPWGA